MDCIFCKIVNKELPSRTLFEDELIQIIMDVNPAVDGHVLIIPKKHYTDYLELNKEIGEHILNVAQEWGPYIEKKMNAQSFTLLVNYGDDQKVKHFHLHILPDYLKNVRYGAKKDIEEVYNLLKK